MNDDQFWAWIAPSLQKSLGLAPLSLDELEDVELVQAPEEPPLTPDEIESIVAYATGRTRHLPPRRVHRREAKDGDDTEPPRHSPAALNGHRSRDNPELDASFKSPHEDSPKEDDPDDDEPRSSG